MTVNSRSDTNTTVKNDNPHFLNSNARRHLSQVNGQRNEINTLLKMQVTGRTKVRKFSLSRQFPLIVIRNL